MNIMVSHNFYVRFLYGFFIFFCTLFIFISLITFTPYDIPWLYASSNVHVLSNSCGMIGAYCAAVLLYAFGFSSYVLVLFGFLYSVRIFLGKENWKIIYLFIGVLCLVLVSCGLQALYAVENPFMTAGGKIGVVGFSFLYSLLGSFGAPLCIFVSILGLFFLLFYEEVYFLIFMITKIVHASYSFLIYLIAPFYTLTHIIVQIFSCIIFVYAKNLIVSFFHISPFALKTCGIQGSDLRLLLDNDDSSNYILVNNINDEKLNNNDNDSLYQKGSVCYLPGASCSIVNFDDTIDNNKNTVIANKLQYRLPDAALFNDVLSKKYNINKDKNDTLALLLKEKLLCFGISGRIVSIKPGPVVTLFEYEPAIDVKVSKILSLENDLALALKAVSVRIVAPIPGTSRVGFEVANSERISVMISEIMHSDVYKKSLAHIPLILGKDTSGEIVIIDLVDMPHLLIAGSTGSGKSIALNTILVSMLCALKPQELQLIIVDPKRLDFSAYRDIPHLLFPIVTDPKRVAPILKWLVATMEERYEFMSIEGARNIFDYKIKCVQNNIDDTLPFIVVIIDELADLMMVAGKEIEDSIARLAQMARAAGISLIIATQRPSVDVLTGLIKVNFPSRISFRVASKIDSRTILDAQGAEMLLGKGDMLFMDVKNSRLKRVHGALITDSEIKKITDYIRSQQEPKYIDIHEALACMRDNTIVESHDPLLPQVYAFLDVADEVSISLLQRKFKIGYNRSARIVEQLEMQGKLLSIDGGKMRKVIR